VLETEALSQMAITSQIGRVCGIQARWCSWVDANVPLNAFHQSFVFRSYLRDQIGQGAILCIPVTIKGMTNDLDGDPDAGTMPEDQFATGSQQLVVRSEPQGTM
jgi:hypothetical protein